MKPYEVTIIRPRRFAKLKLDSFWLTLLLLCFSAAVMAEGRDKAVKHALDALLIVKQHPLLEQPDFSKQSKELLELYRMNAKQLIWLGEGRSEKNLNDALDLLNNAALDGLNPQSYDAGQLGQYLRQAQQSLQTDYQLMVSYDTALSISLLRYIHDLNMGRIDPRSFNYPPQFGAKTAIDAAGLLKRHLDQQKVNEISEAAAPKIRQYHLLKAALASYKTLAQYSSGNKLSFPKGLKPGDVDPQVLSLRQRLQDMGELSAAQIPGLPEIDYDEAAVSAVMRLQQQQGLKPDGLIGSQTLALLNQTPSEKIGLIELAMERLRWLPELPSGPQILVNIPAFQLWAFNSPDDENAINMKVVVGKAEENQTPILWEEMRYLEFMPYWNIPKSILDKEILPKMQTGKNYLTSQDIELVERYANDDGEEADSVIDSLKYGRVRARQLPGKKNPLGKVKFIFPNKADVYLHDTPFRSAFSRDRRDFSHGCVRVAEAEKLAEFVLGLQQGWDRKSIALAMEGPKTQRVSLKKSIPVMFFYTTAYAGQDNRLRFYPDIYGYDAVLQNILNKPLNKLVVSKAPVVDG